MYNIIVEKLLRTHIDCLTLASSC